MRTFLLCAFCLTVAAVGFAFGRAVGIRAEQHNEVLRDKYLSGMNDLASYRSFSELSRHISNKEESAAQCMSDLRASLYADLVRTCLAESGCSALLQAPRATMVVAWLDLVSVGSGSQVVVGGCGACGRRPARWSTRSVVHGKPAGARSASSTNPQPGAAPISAWIAGTCFNKQGAMREHIGTIRTSIQRQSGSAAVAAGERGVGRGFA